ncbi:MAG TPA: MBOAT family O-acyltransferase [Dongiaceae bacterium]|nr:MBOAT family O-acyltransferase [Dongiaceae bacterium]
MNVPSFAFLAFAAAVAALVNVSAAPTWRRAVLLVANVAFAASFSRDSAQLAPFAALLVAGFLALKVLERDKRGSVFVLLLALQLVLFCWLKRYAFVPPALSLPWAYVTVGMSYVFFRVLHLTIDAYQDALGERVGVVSYANYTLNFTSLVSGPIQFYRDYRRTETEAPAPLTRSALGAAAQRIVLGFFKVSVVSPVLLFAHERSGIALAAALFAVYLYANFSGYMDVVVGTARFLRLELPENFDRPFAATGYAEFWGRWHMTLSMWFKTYVYSPLLMALMRRYPSPAAEPYLGVLAYFVTFFFVGVWHGQTAMFLVFGVLQGAGVSANKLYQIAMQRKLGRKRYRALCARPAYAALSRGLTFAYFAFTLLWFWASSPQLAAFGAALGVAGAAAAFACVAFAAALALWLIEAAAAWFARLRAGGAPLASSPYVVTAWCTALVVLTLSVTAVLNAPAPHIVYRAF